MIMCQGTASSVSVVFASIRPVPGIVRGLPSGLACGPPPGVMPSRPAGLVSSPVHADEDHRDEREDDQHERPGPGEVMTWPVHEDRDTSQH
jgi:hypothetical protein